MIPMRVGHYVVLSVLLATSAVACGEDSADDRPPDFAEEIPAAVADTLATAGIRVSEVKLSEEAAGTVLGKFGQHYRVDEFEDDPVVYAVQVESAGGEAMLQTGEEVWMIHVAGLESDRGGPAPPPSASGSSEPLESIEVDMFSFLDPQDSSLLTTVYLEPVN